MTFEGDLGRTGQPDRLAGAHPVYAQLAAADVHAHLWIEQTALAADDDCCAGARAAGERLADTPFIDPQADVGTIDDFHEAHIDPSRKAPMALDGGTQACYGCGI